MQAPVKYPLLGGGDANTASGPRGRSAQVAAGTATDSAGQGPRLHCGCNPARTLAISPTPAYFKPGDRVRLTTLTGVGISKRVWTVRSLDTNLTPVRDHEPAYELREGLNGRNTRYAYQSDLHPAGDE